MNDAWSEAKNATAVATSIGSPYLPSACVSLECSKNCKKNRRFRSNCSLVVYKTTDLKSFSKYLENTQGGDITNNVVVEKQ